MICVLKTKDNKYIAAVNGTLRVDMRIGQRSRVPNTKVHFQVTDNIRQARMIENPNLKEVLRYGLKAVGVYTNEDGGELLEIIEHE